MRGGENTKCKKLIFIIAILILLSVSAASAADNGTDDASDSGNEDSLSATNVEVLSAEPPGTFTDLNNEIETAGPTLDLTRNYTYNMGDPELIVINRDLTINGIGNIVMDANGAKGIFNITAGSVTLNNITFINAAQHAVYVGADNCRIENSIFYNNSINQYDSGAAIYWAGNQGTVTNSYFYNNTVKSDDDDKLDVGGAIFWAGNYGTVSYCNFTNNKARNGGAISWGYYWYDKKTGEHFELLPEHGVVDHCNFNNNTAYYHGAAVMACGHDFTIRESNITNNTGVYSAVLIVESAKNANISHCNFENNTAVFHDKFMMGNFVGSAALEVEGYKANIEYCNFTNNNAYGGMYWRWDEEEEDFVFDEIWSFSGAVKVDSGAENTVMVYCNFDNNSAEDYGAVEWLAINGIIKYSNFTDNRATRGNAGAVQWSGDAEKGTVLESNFIDNNAFAFAGAIYWDGGDGKVLNSNFTSNSANENGGAIYWNGADGEVLNSNFTVNSADENGGAIYWIGDDGEVLNSNFTSNSALNGGAIFNEGYPFYIQGSNFTSNSAENGGAIYLDYGASVSDSDFTGNNATDMGGAICIADDSEITSSNFTSNSAKNGGAIFCGVEYWGNIYGSATITFANFSDNKAFENGGAIYYCANDQVINNANFTGNTAKNGGAIFCGLEFEGDLYGSATITFANFSDNKASENGGAIFNEGNQFYIYGSNFTSNSALNGGAIFNGWDQCSIEGSNFTSNSAENGGAIYLYYGASVSDSDFTGNNATDMGGAICIADDSKISSSNFASNSAMDGGAIFCGIEYEGYLYGSVTLTFANFSDNKASENGGAIYYAVEGQVIDNANFTGNTAVYGGAIFTEASNINIDTAYFNNNNATNGSAIYKTANADEFKIANVEFGRNRANSSEIRIEIIGNETYELSNVTVKVYFIANDNIANAIWNDGDFDSIKLANITCEFSYDGIGREYKTFNKYDTPKPIESDYYVKGSDRLWQNALEDAQLLDINITDSNGNIIYSIVNGQETRNSTVKRNVLKAAGPTDSNPVNVTDVEGKISIEFTNLKAGTYNVSAEHKWDAYYTLTANADSFVVYGVKLLVNKTADVKNVANNSIVNYTITVKNIGNGKATGVNITDYLPQNLTYSDEWGIIKANGATITPNNQNNLGWRVSNITNGSFVSIWFTAKVNTNAAGNITNTVSVNCNENKTAVSNESNVTVVPVNLTIVKFASPNNLTIGENLTFTITVTNNAKVNATNVNITDILDSAFRFDGISTNLTCTFNDNKITWIIDNLENGASMSVAFNVTVVKVGNFENVAAVNCSENTTVVNDKTDVTVNKAPSLVNGTNVTVFYGDPIVVPYNSTNATNVIYEIYDGDKLVVSDTVGPDGTIDVKQLPVGNYTVNWTTVVDDNHTSATNTSTIEVLPIPTSITVGNVTTFAGKEVTIPINVTADDGKPFNGNVTITFPDGTNKTVKIINGTGTTTWFVPYDYTPGKYPDTVKFNGDNKYLPSEGKGTITVIKIPVDVIVGNVTGKPGDNVTIPINVIPRDGSVFNGKVTVVLPDGTKKVIDIVNGKGSVDWTIPKDYTAGKYPVRVYSNETNIYYPANGTGYVTVIVDPAMPDNKNKTPEKPSKQHSKSGLEKYETGNPIIALLIVLTLLGINTKRRK